MDKWSLGIILILNFGKTIYAQRGLCFFQVLKVLSKLKAFGDKDALQSHVEASVVIQFREELPSHAVGRIIGTKHANISHLKNQPGIFDVGVSRFQPPLRQSLWVIGENLPARACREIFLLVPSSMRRLKWLIGN